MKISTIMYTMRTRGVHTVVVVGLGLLHYRRGKITDMVGLVAQTLYPVDDVRGDLGRPGLGEVTQQHGQLT